MVKTPLRPLIYNPPSQTLSVVYKDDHILVLSKPSGLLSVPGRDKGHKDCLETRAKVAFPDAHLVHRLDLETSGLFVMALSKTVQSNLGKQFQQRKVNKTYIARVFGTIEGEDGQIDLPLICDWPNRPLQKVCHETGKPAQTDWKVLSRDKNSTLVELSPLTGRSHQLRVHMAMLNHEAGGHPILGDPFYADEVAYKAAPRLLLHASALEFHHPDNGQIIRFEDPVPDIFGRA